MLDCGGATAHVLVKGGTVIDTRESVQGVSVMLGSTYRLNESSLWIVSIIRGVLGKERLTSISARIGQRGGAITIPLSCLAL